MPTTQTEPKELPSLKKAIMNPKTLSIIIVISLALNFLLIILIFYVSAAKNPKITPLVNVTPLPTSVVQPTERTTPTKTLSDIEKCFKDCNEKDFLSELTKQIKKVTSNKGTISYYNLENNTCYGETLVASAPDKEMLSSFIPENCNPISAYKPEKLKYFIGSNAYYYDLVTKRWEQGSIPPRVQLRIQDHIDAITKQETLSSKFENVGLESYRIVTGESKTVNEYNQTISISYKIYVKSNYEVTSYEFLNGVKSKEIGSFYAFNVPNNIEVPK